MNFNLGASTTPGTTYDQLVYGGTTAASLSGVTINLYPLATAGTGTFTLISGNVTGTPTFYDESKGTAAAGRMVYTTNVTSSAVTATVTSVPNYNFTFAGAAGGSSNNVDASGTWTGGAAGTYPGQVPADTMTFALGGNYQNTYYQMTMDTNSTVSTVTLQSTGGNMGRLTLAGSNTLTVINPITLGSGQNLYGSTWAAPISMTGGILGWAGFAGYGYVGSGPVTATSGTSILGSGSVSNTLTVNSGATVQVGDPASVTYGGQGVAYAPTAYFNSATILSGGMLTSGVSGSTLGMRACRVGPVGRHADRRRERQRFQRRRDHSWRDGPEHQDRDGRLDHHQRRHPDADQRDEPVL